MTIHKMWNGTFAIKSERAWLFTELRSKRQAQIIVKALKERIL